jgi:hypothetical protein
MKKVVSVLIVITMMATLISVCSFGQNTNEYLIIRVLESINKNLNMIMVTNNGEILEKIELPPMTYKGETSAQLEANKVLNKYENSGYELLTVTSGCLPNGESRGVLVTTYLLKA